jgi:hypothetical protein
MPLASRELELLFGEVMSRKDGAYNIKILSANFSGSK